MDAIGDYVARRAQKTKRVVDDQVVSLSRSLLKYTIIGLAILTALENLEVDTTMLVTVSGVLSLSVALGATDAVKNVFGLFVVVIDRPFVLGDHVKIAGVEGFVQSIKLRQTTIKTFNGTKVLIPNATFISTPVENFYSQRETRMRLTWVVAYRDSPSEALRELRQSLYQHTRGRDDTGSWVDVNTIFTAAGIEISWTFCYIKGEGVARKEGWTFYEEARNLKQDMLLFAKDEMTRLGLPFATFPVDMSTTKP